MIRKNTSAAVSRWAEPGVVAAAIDGRGDAVERLIAAVWPGCFRVAASVIGDRNLAQDAAQEACAIVHRKVRSVRSVAAFDAWLYRVVMREAARVRRRQQPGVASSMEPFTVGDGSAAVDIWRALESLSPELRDVTVLFYFDDLQTDEIAAILRVHHATVRTRLLRARERLRHLLDDYRPATPASRTEQKHVI